MYRADHDPTGRRVRETASTLAELYADKAFGGPWDVNERYKKARDRGSFIEDTTRLLNRIEPTRECG
jgi:hypothetical protein